MVEKRQKISRPLEQRLKNYFDGKRCVITGAIEKNGLSINWAHLDEDPSNTTFSNIIPLSSGFNLTQEEWRRNKEAQIGWFNRTISLKSNYLSYQSLVQFRSGLPALAYGCSRLGKVLAIKYQKEFEASVGDVWEFFCKCLYYLPYRMDYELLESVLVDLNKYIDLQLNCPNALRASLLQAIANLYQDNGQWNEADEIYKTLHFENQIAPNMLASICRRQAIGSVFLNSATDSNYLFEKAIELNGDFDFQTSINIAKAWQNLKDQSPKTALLTLERYNEIFKNPKIEPIEILSPHNIYELAFTQSAALLKLGKKYTKQLEIVNKLHVIAPNTQLRPVFTEYISKNTFDEEICLPIKTLSTHLLPTKKVIILLNIVTKKLLI
jgi:hypothetical protein